MIYLVSNQTQLYQPDLYECITAKEALALLEQENLLGGDTETEGLDFLSKKLLTIQLGTKEFQIVWDCTTVNPLLLKPILEEKTTLWWNYLFDGLFLYKLGIFPKNVIDLMLQEQLLYLGMDSKFLRLKCEDAFGEGFTPFSLKTAVKRYCGEDLDKTVRGKIITQGLTPEVIVYSARDVQFEPDIYIKQKQALTEKDLVKAALLENEFVKTLTYTKFCGVKLDVNKWRAKMQKDQVNQQKYLDELNRWVLDFWDKRKTKDLGKIILEVNVGINYEDGSYKALEVNLPKGSKLLSGKVKTLYDEEGHRLLYNIATYEVPFGYTLRGVFHPYIYKEMQGDLFLGFNSDPQCTINWKSSSQVIPLLEMLGFNLNTIDKKTKLPKKSAEAKLIKAQKHISSISEPYLLYKKAEKVCSTYGQNWIDAIGLDGRIHPEYNQLGAGTARLSSGGGDDEDSKKLNIQNLPKNAETRSCFVCEKGNRFISEDYKSQESRIIASVANDPAMLHIYDEGQCEDMHSLVTKMAFPKETRDCPIEEIKHRFPELRDMVKSQVEFPINYGGDFNTIHEHSGKPKEECKEIYDNYMKGFPGVKKYQDYCRMAVMRDGYILCNPITGHKSFIEDWDELSAIQEEMKSHEFWEEYRELKKIDPDSDICRKVRRFYRRKSDLEKASINYRIQNRGAMCFKLSSIKFFNYIVKHNLLNIVKMCIPVHDEWNIECPEEMAEEISLVLQKCMEEGAKPFCTRLPLSTDISIGDHWIH